MEELGAHSDEHEELAEVAMDGTDEDALLSQSMVLSRAEVVRRRSRRVKQLVKLYHGHYWALMEELRTKYRRFYLLTGRSGWREDAIEEDDGGEGGSMRQQVEPEQLIKCAYQACKLKPMPLSAYCFSHILLEPRQCLYKPCAFVVRGGQATCGKPVLRAVVPSFCPMHLQMAQKQAAKVMRRLPVSSGLPPLAGKGAPKLHVLISEYVRAIQTKRRANAASGTAAGAAGAAAAPLRS